MTTVRCFEAKKQIVCVDDFAHNVINLTTKEYHTLTVCEYEKLLLQLEGAKELTVTEVEKHRYEIRTYYRIYRVTIGQHHKYFMEIFDGSSAMYEYIFCRTKSRCIKLMREREQDNKMLY